MFTRSKGFLLSLVALLGVFSSYASADSPYILVYKNSTSIFIPDFDGRDRYGNLDAYCAAAGWPYTGSTWTSSSTVWKEISCGGAGRLEYRQTLQPNGDFPVAPYDIDEKCINPDSSDFQLAFTPSECALDADEDSDGTPNVLDSDSNLYDPDYCTDNPTASICPDDSGGGDTGGGDGSGGGDTGGGGSGGGGLPSSCEGSPTFSESCCFDHAEAQCLDEGGLYDWGYVSVGTPACNFTCNDTVNPPDNGGGDGSGGDSGGSGDGGSGSDDTPTDNTDLITAVNTLQTANQTEFNAIQDDLNTLNQTNQAGFNDVRSAIENIQNPDLTALENSNNQIATNTAQTASNAADIATNLNALNTANQQGLSSVNDALTQLRSDFNAVVDSDFNSANFESQLDGTGTPDDIVNAGMGDFEAANGIDKDGELETEIINLGDEINKYDPMLGGSSSECPSDYSLTVAGAQYSISWTPVCDAFGILSIFVQAAAWFAVPFIVLGVGKK
ncbi:hypothetical protein DEU29_101246 [Idiomarina aquatica]|uniref:Thrombospondin type 3 repeat-containing protein n=1 Tax=Idiomarina aquatica TaxID=1327752 RepID=A0A4R6PQR3_9GAMM|nr:virulence factor TspB C-terminal domain-related protein [Idiomarina aquatica]TDP40696.1 hypothetical protein DEU29_101246 [Idiomarina aquatica]